MRCDAAQFEAVAAVTCRKPAGETPDQCFARRRDQPYLCRGHDKCRLAGMTAPQMAYVLHPLEAESYLKACPGSGKTESIAVRAAYLLGAKPWTFYGIAFLTFTNNAADVIRERVARAGWTSSVYPHFVGTFDSWLHGYLLNPFGFHVTGYAGKHGDRSVAIIESGSSAPFLHAYKTGQPLPGSGHVHAHQYYYDPEEKLIFNSGERSLDAVRDKIAWSAEQLAELRQLKAAFWKAGFATYADVETICLRLLRTFPKLARMIALRFPFIVVDECQDLGPGQLGLLEELRKAGTRLHFVGDRHQAIYSFRKADAAQVVKFAADRGFVELLLAENFRSFQAIVDFCGKLVDQGKIVGQTSDQEAPTCVYLTYDKPEDIGDLAGRFEALLNERKLDPARSVVLARGTAMLARIDRGYADKPLNSAHEFARSLYLWKTGRFELRDEALALAGTVLAGEFFPKEVTKPQSHHQPLSIHFSSEWRLLLARVLDHCVVEPAVSNLDQTWSTWAALAKVALPGIVHALNSDCDEGIVPGFRAPSGLAKAMVSASFVPPAGDETKLKCSTIHKVKGQTMDAVLVVSSPDAKSKGGHWSQWLDPSLEDGEYSRFAYVASSRPRYLLAWALCLPKKKAQIEGFNALGLSQVP